MSDTDKTADETMDQTVGQAADETARSKSPEEIEAEIERQREQLAGTIDALSAKLDVKSQAQAKIAEVRDRATTDSGRPRAELIAAGVGVVAVVVLVVWWKRR